jgi:hypothetical protein
MTGAEDRATQGCDLSADPGAKIDRERVQLAPPVLTNLGSKAINPGGLGVKPLRNGVPELQGQAPNSVRLIELVDTAVAPAAPSITMKVPPSTEAGKPVRMSVSSEIYAGRAV